VCVETLKRDWSSALKLRDVLVTISCLLIQPNPASALNEAAGKLASEDWDGFCRRAKLMTEIHAAVPNSIAKEVKEAQMRGEDIPLETGPVPTETTAQASREKEWLKGTPASSKRQRLVTEDEENIRRRGDTQEPESDPESDWIPGPNKVSKPITRRENNIFGIKGLDDDMQLGTSPKRIYAADAPQPASEEKEQNDNSEPFITVTSKRTIHTSQSFDIRLPTPSVSQAHTTSTDTPELLKFSHQNPFSVIQPNNQTHPLLKEFSYPWEDSEILHDTGLIQDGVSKLEVRKRLAGEGFEKKRDWEMKRFKKTGYDLKRYNRGDFGPRIGMGRL
jgi:ubiquitin-conjugating enzyme E2 S